MAPPSAQLALAQLQKFPVPADPRTLIQAAAGGTRAGTLSAGPPATTPIYALRHTLDQITNALVAGGCDARSGQYKDIVDLSSCWMGVVQGWAGQIDIIGSRAVQMAATLASTPRFRVDDSTREGKLANAARAQLEQTSMKSFAEAGKALLTAGDQLRGNAQQIAAAAQNYRNIWNGWKALITDPNADAQTKARAQTEADAAGQSAQEIASRLALAAVDDTMTTLEFALATNAIMDQTVTFWRDQSAGALAGWARSVRGWGETVHEFQSAVAFERGVGDFTNGLLGAPGKLIGKTGEGIGKAIGGVLKGTGDGVAALGRGAGLGLLWLIPGAVIVGGLAFGIYYWVTHSKDHVERRLPAARKAA